MKDLSNLKGQEKHKYVQDNFDDIAQKYNLFNDISTFFLHRIWKKKIIKFIEQEKKNNLKALDLCCGTGDIAINLAQSKYISEIKAVDFSKNMIKIAKKNLNIYKNVTCEIGDVTNLFSIQNESYDIITMGFGLRNVNDRDKTLSEVFRILKKEGTFICLDIGKISIRLLKPLADFYFFKVVPFIGNRIYKSKENMFEYLPLSSIHYPSQKDLFEILRLHHFSNIIIKEFLFGNIVLHKAKKEKINH